MASWWPGALLGTWQYSAPRASAPGCSCVPPPPRWPGVSIPVIMFSTTIPDLGPGLPGGLRLGGHGPHQLLRHPDVLYLDPLHRDAPVEGPVSKQVLGIGNVNKSVPLSPPRPTCISWAILTRSERMSPRVRVPSTFLKVVAARAWAEPA